METQKFLTDKKGKSLLEGFLTDGFKEFSFEKTMIEIVNVDILTMVDGDLTTLIISYKDSIVNEGGNLEDKYFTKHVLIDKNLNILTKNLGEDLQFLKILLDKFKGEYVLN